MIGGPELAGPASNRQSRRPMLLDDAPVAQFLFSILSFCSMKLDAVARDADFSSQHFASGVNLGAIQRVHARARVCTFLYASGNQEWRHKPWCTMGNVEQY